MRRRWLAVLPVAALLSAVVAPGAADAVAPSKAGWWNAAGAGGLGVPLPTTSAGNLHVGQGLTSPNAIAAVGYALTGGEVTSAVLELKLTNVVGTPVLAVCVTKDNAWKPVEDGDMAEAPAYDCTKGHAYGVVSATGDTVTFLLSEALQLADSYSLVIVPEEGALPFQTDIVKPGVESLTISGSEGPVPVDAAAPPPPPATGDSGSAPLSPGTTVAAPATAPLAAGPAPAVASPETAAQAPAVAAPVTPAASRRLPPVSNRERYIAGSMLALLAGALVWALQQPLPTPRLIGGLARANPGGVPEDAPVRGIGRFASARLSPARQLL